MRPRLVLLLCCAALPSSCGHRSAVAPGADGGPSNPPSIDTGIAASDGACSVRYAIDTPVPFDCGTDHFGEGALDIDDGWILYTAHRTLGSNSGADADLFERNAATGQLKQLTADDLETVLLAASEGSVLYSTYTPQKTSAQLSWRTASGQVVDLGTDVQDIGEYFEFTAERSRLISDGKVVWRGAQTIHLYDGTSAHSIATIKNGSYISLDHQAGRVAWSASDGKDGEIFLYQGGSVTQLTSNDIEDRKPQLWGSSVLWICGDAICRWDAGATQVLDKGKCTDVIARQDRAAWVCDSQVMLFDGSTARPLAGSRGDKLTREGLRLDGGRLLWLEAPDPFPFQAHGKVFFSDGEQTLQLAETGLPCLYCNAYWPPLQLVLRGDVAAWSYDVSSPLPDPQPPWPCAFTTIRKQLDCAK